MTSLPNVPSQDTLQTPLVTLPAFVGDVAVVTGAAQGMGAQIARRLASAGAAVALWDRDADGAERTASRITADTGARTLAVGCDVAAGESVEAAHTVTQERLGLPNRVVMAAGIAVPAPFLDVGQHDFDRQLAVNLTGTFLVLQRCAAALAAAGQRGSMVAIASVAARGPRPDLTAYAASKAGVVSVVRSAAVALAPAGITVNAVCPGVVDTEMTRRTQRERAQQWGISEQEALQRLTSRIPLGRIQTTDDVADVVLFLLSAGGAYVTGQALNACGGLEFD